MYIEDDPNEQRGRQSELEEVDEGTKLRAELIKLYGSAEQIVTQVKEVEAKKIPVLKRPDKVGQFTVRVQTITPKLAEELGIVMVEPGISLDEGREVNFVTLRQGFPSLAKYTLSITALGRKDQSSIVLFSRHFCWDMVGSFSKGQNVVQGSRSLESDSSRELTMSDIRIMGVALTILKRRYNRISG